MLNIGIILVLIGILLLFIAYKKKRAHDFMTKNKVLPIGQLQANTQVEVKGDITVLNPMKTPFSQQDCVYYSYTIEREVEKTDSQGRQIKRWEKIGKDSKNIPFQVQDETGKILIQPDKAEIDAQTITEKFINKEGVFDNSISKGIVKIGRGFRTRIKEKAILVNSSVYIFGKTTQATEGLVIKDGLDGFIITHKSEEEIEKKLGRAIIMLNIGGAALIFIGVWLMVFLRK